MAVRSRVAAHRGGALVWPENSLLAFRNTLGLGLDLVEFDVHPTADGGVAVIHDPTLERTTEGTGAVAERSGPELKALRLRGPDGGLGDERLPLLDDLLALLAPTKAELLVEMKGPLPIPGVAYERRGDDVAQVAGPRYEALEERVLAALAGAGLAERSMIMAFNPEVLRRVGALAPRQRRALLVAELHVLWSQSRAEDTVAWATRVGATDLGLQHTLVTESVMAAARAAGLAVGVWVVNEEAEMRRLADLGVDVITTDRPDLAARVLGQAA